MRGITRLKRMVRNTRRLFQPVAAILIYHRVIALPADEYYLAVTPDHFACHLEIIRKKYTPIHLSQLPDAIRARSLPHRSVIVTFDDGYSDNFSKAMPLLESYQVPATIFTVSGMVNSPCEFWWDEVERIMLTAADLPTELAISLGGEALRLPTAGVHQRRSAFTALHRQIRAMPFEEREKALCDLRRWAGLSPEGRPENLPVKLSTLRQAAKSQYIEIGAHTRTHPVLSAQHPDVQRAEILDSRVALEAALNRSVRVFAYPFGNQADYTQQTADIVRQAGFVAAVTTVQGVFEPGDDLFQLKRCQVDDWDAETFEKRLDAFFTS